VEHENSNRNDSVFSRKIRAGRRRTYFFDVRTTKGNDYYITITESKKRFDGNGYDRHKLFIYKEDFNKFADELQQVIDHIKGLLPDFDFDAFAHRYDENGEHYDGGNHQHHDDDREQYNDNSNSSSSDNTSTDNNSGHHYGDEDLKL